jgi:hypothetical protein
METQKILVENLSENEQKGYFNNQINDTFFSDKMDPYSSFKTARPLKISNTKIKYYNLLTS